MAVILLMLLSFAGYIIAYNTYGRFLSKKIFKLDDKNRVPSQELSDGKDYVPTKKSIIFGHHYTSIAGTGPIVGPAIGIIWGWVPAMIWVFVGSIVMGAVHDFGALVISLRNQGKSVSDITAKFICPRVRMLFFLLVFFALLIVIAIFGIVIAAIFKMFPGSVFAVWMQIPIAVALGWIVYKRGGNLKLYTLVAVVLMYITIILGKYLQFVMPELAGIPATGVWTLILLVYVFFASSLPVTTLLQPRDYINAWQLFIALALLVIGIIASGIGGRLQMAAPAYNATPAGAPPMMPFLFITIACGAVSGFHSLVSSGTSAKQIEKESDALMVGYGSMLMEAVLATLVIIAVGAGIAIAYKTADGEVLTGLSAWQQHYSSWEASKGLGSKVMAVVIGSANMIKSIGIPESVARIIMGVFIASFAGTTLDTATRIQRYIVSELFTAVKVKAMTRVYPATLFAVVTAAILAFATGADGKGALKLWPMFGAVNQILAGLALLLITLYLKSKVGLKYLISGIPCVFMLFMTIWSASLNQLSFINSGNGLLIVLNCIILILAIWIAVEGVLTFVKKKAVN